uniref:Uncharacterized protein n=1 Tax=Hucho hucho TaxID=62062 RepID=A0A4W5JAF5_9TELE
PHISLSLALFLQCPDSACKQDLLAYLQRIALYCHQLNICSKVKAEVQNLGGELVVSGVIVLLKAEFISVSVGKQTEPAFPLGFCLCLNLLFIFIL